MYYSLSSSPVLHNHLQIMFSAIPRTPFLGWGDLYLCWEYSRRILNLNKRPKEEEEDEEEEDWENFKKILTTKKKMCIIINM